MSTANQTAEYVILSGAPAVPGLTFRRLRGEPDYPKMVEVIRSCKEADNMDQVTTLEELANNYQHLVNCDPAVDMWIAEVGGQMIGYSRVQWSQEQDGTRIYESTGKIRPEWRRKGIGRAMLHACEQRLREIAAGHPNDSPRLFHIWMSEDEVGRNVLVRSEGYEPAAYFAEMLRPDLENIPDAPLPDGIEMRPVLPEHYRPIWEADREANRDHWGFTEEEFSDVEYERWLNHPVIFTPHLWCIAWDGDQVVGMVRSFIVHEENEEYGRKWGYPEFISVRRAWRRRGIARALLCRSLHVLKEQGMEAANLGVHTDNPNGALPLYESVGFKTIRMYLVYRKPMTQGQ